MMRKILRKQQRIFIGRSVVVIAIMAMCGYLSTRLSQYIEKSRLASDKKRKFHFQRQVSEYGVSHGER